MCDKPLLSQSSSFVGPCKHFYAAYQERDLVEVDWSSVHMQRPSFTELRQHLTQLFKDLQQQRQQESSTREDSVQFHSHSTVRVQLAGDQPRRGEVLGSV